jgi:uncharacterized damage-inducible protein DinB
MRTLEARLAAGGRRPLNDGMNPLKIYDYLTLARGRILRQTGMLSAEQYVAGFSIGPGSVARTLTHIMICEWMYAERIAGRPVPPYEQWPIRDEDPPAFAVLEMEWARQAAKTRDVVASVRDWEEELEYPGAGGGTPAAVVASRSDIFTQLAFHEVHHRGQVMNMLRRMGIAAEDLDYNAIMYKRRGAG